MLDVRCWMFDVFFFEPSRYLVGYTDHAKHRHRETLSICAAAVQRVLDADHRVVVAVVSPEKPRRHFLGMRRRGPIARIAQGRPRCGAGVEPLPAMRSDGGGVALVGGGPAFPYHGELASVHAGPRAVIPFAAR